MNIFSFFTTRRKAGRNDIVDENGNVINSIQDKKNLNINDDDRSYAETDTSQTIAFDDDDVLDNNTKDPKRGSKGTIAATKTSPEENETLEGVMGDNLDLMLEIILKVREDEDFAKSIYEDCPRLQLLLDQNPDLRPIFEDPHFIRINFEQVYRNAGGVLPEDEQNAYYKATKEILITITRHPLFRVFRFLLLIRRVYNFFVNGMFNIFRNLYISMFGLNAWNLTNLFENGPTPDDLHKENLYRVAEHMEDPVVQEQMATLLESHPDDIDEAIEQDPELMALRDSNELCAELMSDPNTLRILLDPDNLRALADCPELIAADFEDPDWMPPEMESAHFDDTVQPVYDDELLAIDEEGEEEVEEGSAILNSSLALMEELEGPEAHGQQQQQQQKNASGEQRGGVGGTVAGMAGAGMLGYLASQIGLDPNDMMMNMSDGMVEDDFFDAVDETAQTTADTVAETAKTSTDVAVDEAQRITDEVETAAIQVSETLVGTSEEITEQDREEAQQVAIQCATAVATTAAIGAVMMVGGGDDQKKKQSDKEDNLLKDDHEDSDASNDNDGKENVDANPKASARRFFQRNR